MSTKMPTTALGTFNVLNYTRYCTEDLVAIINAIEASVPQVAYISGKPALGGYAGRQNATPDVPTIVFKDFTGVPVHDYSYALNKRIKGQRFILAKRRWRAPLEFRLLPPEKLHDNPIEALAASTQEVPTVPDVMRDEIVKRIVELFVAFESYGPFRGQFTPAEVNIPIRIFKRRAANAPKRNRRVQMIERATSRAQEVTYRLHSAAKTCDNLRVTYISLLQTAAQLGIPSADRSHTALFDALDLIKAESERINAAVKELQ